MTLELLVLIIIWVLGFIAVVLFIPRHKRREAFMSFFPCQSITWVNTMIQVKYGLLTFPVREFPKASDVLFTSEYIMYPLMCAFYYIYEPKSGKLLRFVYLAGCISFLTLVDNVIANYTDLIHYTKYSWYWTWINFFLIFLVVNVFCKWFFKPGVFTQDRRTAR